MRLALFLAAVLLAACGGVDPQSAPDPGASADLKNAPVSGADNGSGGGGGQSKVTICHVPPGNPDNRHTITVGAPAVPAHLAHGDTIGPCAPACSMFGGPCAQNSDCCPNVGLFCSPLSHTCVGAG